MENPRGGQNLFTQGSDTVIPVSVTNEIHCRFVISLLSTN